MKYAVLIYDTETANPSPEPPPAAEADAMMREYFAYSKLLTDRQANLGGEALQPATTATTLRMKDGAIVTTDGPFAETKEALGGFYLIEATDLDEALELAAKCPGVRFGAIEVRPVTPGGDRITPRRRAHVRRDRLDRDRRAVRQAHGDRAVAGRRAQSWSRRRDGPRAGGGTRDHRADRTRGLLADYPYLHAARADLLRRLGRLDEAAAAYRRASDLTANEAEKAFLSRRLAEVSTGPRS